VLSSPASVTHVKWLDTGLPRTGSAGDITASEGSPDPFSETARSAASKAVTVKSTVSPGSTRIVLPQRSRQ
jgi:hypothetical protein